MTQIRRNDAFKHALGSRLKTLVEQHLRLSWAELSGRLGYKNSSVLRQAREGRTLLSAEKLAALAEIGTGDGQRYVSIDWLLTGDGVPLLRRAKAEPAAAEIALAHRVIHASTDAQLQIAAYLDIAES